MSYSIDPQLAPWLPVLPDIDVSDPESARATERSLLAQAPPFSLEGLVVEDRAVPGSAGAPEVPVRVYRPASMTGLLPGIVQIHSGGFVTGGLDTDEGAAASIARSVGAVVVSVGYRLAPEHVYPAAVEDCYAALVWLAGSAAELGVDSDRIAVSGHSAGGGLAAAVALLARDRRGPTPAFQLLGFPQVDDRFETESMHAYVDTPVWHRRNAEASWAWYLGDTAKPGDPDVPPYAAPARADDLSGLPPAYVAACQFDPLRDEGLEYGRRLAQANVPVELHLYPGTFHGSTFVADADISQRMTADTVAALRRALST